MSGFDIQFTGLNELTQRIQSAFGDSLNEDILNKGAEVLRDELEETVYTNGFKRITGRSEDSFKIEVNSDGKVVFIGVSSSTSDAFYLYFQEYGTSRSRARPFLRPTFERKQQDIIAAMAAEMRSRLR